MAETRIIPPTIAIKKHTDRVAVIIEDRPLGNLIPVILHFHVVLGPEWPVILYTTQPTAEILLRSASFSRAVNASEIEIRYLPANTFARNRYLRRKTLTSGCALAPARETKQNETATFSTHASVSAFLTNPYLWTDLAPYARVLLFQADSILCAGATTTMTTTTTTTTTTVDEFVAAGYDLVGAPIAAGLGRGFNGGLSLRGRDAVLRVLRRWDFAADNRPDDSAGGGGGGGGGNPDGWRFEDQWLYARLRDLDGPPAVLPDAETAARFAVESVWVDGARPLGFHQPHRWQADHMEEIMAYCPEVGMIAGSSFF
ncbi:putative formate dehydrogenase protein [Rosellinia necatrix]|uniref:Putative formate dehydrogenase protein n=1 Tax=Rosellinia necatrix TaxID=77044 RepID=A0A1W2TEI7_ROSNE|nr:putative formate dehydrogenase protein [Rosellinia necatrix]